MALEATELKRGLLSKRAVSATFVKPWRTRLLVLRPGVIEWYHVKPQGAGALGSLALTAGSIVDISTERNSALSVTTDGVRLILSAETSAERDAWLRAIRDAVSSLQQAPPERRRESYADDDAGGDEPVTVTVQVVVPCRSLEWIASFNLEAELAEALSHVVSAAPPDPIAFLAAHFASRQTRPASSVHALTRLQAVVRGYLLRKRMDRHRRRSDSLAHDLLVQGVLRQRAASIVQVHARRRSSIGSSEDCTGSPRASSSGEGSTRPTKKRVKWFASLQPILKDSSMAGAIAALKDVSASTKMGLEISQDEVAERTRGEELQKEMSRLADAHRTYARKMWRAFEAGAAEAIVVDTIRQYRWQRQQQAERVVTLSNPYAQVDFSGHLDGDSRWWKIGLHNHGPNGAELHGFFPYVKVAQLLKKAGYRCACILEHETCITVSEPCARVRVSAAALTATIDTPMPAIAAACLQVRGVQRVRDKAAGGGLLGRRCE